jgi:hypothetical protein
MMHPVLLMTARKITAALTLALAIVAATAPVALADDNHRTAARTAPAGAVSDTGATLTGTVWSSRSDTWYRFEYGTDRYSAATPLTKLNGARSWTPVSATVTGLKPSTLYHYRLVVISWGDVDSGGDQTFTTAAPAPAPVAPAPAAIPAPVAPAPLPVAPPVIGKTMVVAPVAGVVKVQAPGGSGFTALTAGSSVPVGAVVDTRAGTVQLTSAVSGGKTQDGTFRGALFQVRQSAKGTGMTDLVLRGGNFSVCPRASRARGRAAAVQRRRKPPVRRLWGSDKGGRFRTHGRNSVATVRGTRWVTTDTCAGTRTTVTEGAVSVRDLNRRKTVLVRAGKSYLARRR